MFTNYSKDVSSIVDSVGGAPCIIKLLEGTQGLGVVLADTKKAAVAVCEAFNSLKARVIVQEFIKESRGIDIRAFVVDGRVVGAMKRTGKEGEFRSNLHRGGTAQLIELTHEEEVTAIKAAKALGLHVAGVDMLQSDRGPLGHRGELEPRPRRHRSSHRQGHRRRDREVHRAERVVPAVRPTASSSVQRVVGHRRSTGTGTVRARAVPKHPDHPTTR